MFKTLKPNITHFSLQRPKFEKKNKPKQNINEKTLTRYLITKPIYQGFLNFSESRRPFQQKIFTWRPIIYYLFGRAGGGLLLQQIEKLTKLGTIGGNLQFSLFPSLFTVVALLKFYTYVK